MIMSEINVIYKGASDAQVNYGGGDDPRKILRVDDNYKVIVQEVRSWHTLYIL